MKLLPEQVVLLTEELEKLKDEYRSLINAKDINVANITLGDEADDAMGIQVVYDIQKLMIDIDELENQLKSCSIINVSDSDVISVGTIFTAETDFGDEKETCDYIMLDMISKNTVDAEPITVNSPFGKAVMGKKVNDNYSYSVNGNTYNGVVTNIRKKNKTIVK